MPPLPGGADQSEVAEPRGRCWGCVSASAAAAEAIDVVAGRGEARAGEGAAGLRAEEPVAAAAAKVRRCCRAWPCSSGRRCR